MIQKTATASYTSDPYDTDQSSGAETFTADSAGVFAAPSTQNTAVSSATTLIVGASAPANTLYEVNGDIPAISPLDMNQRNIGDCYAIATFGALAMTDPAYIENLIQSEGNGVYDVTLYDGGTTPVKVPVNINAILSGNYGQDAPVVVNGVDETWMVVLEAAFAEFRNNIDLSGNTADLTAAYANANGGWMSEVYTDLGIANTNQFFSVPTISQLLSLWQAGDMITFGVLAASSTYNLIGDHAYMFAGLTTVGGQTYVELLNPWGTAYENNEPDLISAAQWSTVYNADIEGMTYGAPGTAADLSPSVTAIQFHLPAGSLGVGSVMTIDLTWSNAVTISSANAVSLALSNGGTATYVSGSGTNNLQFTYTVASGQSTSSLAVWGINESGAYGVNFYDLSDTATGQQASTYLGGTAVLVPIVASSILNLSGSNNIENVSNYTINMALDTVATVNGTGNTVNVGNGSTLTLTGSGNTATGSASASSSTGTTVTVAGTNELVNFSYTTIDALSSTSATVTGSNNTINGVSGDALTVTGTNDTVNGSGMAITLGAGNTGGNVSPAQPQLTLLPGDFNGDGMVNFNDLLLVIQNFGKPGDAFEQLVNVIQDFNKGGGSTMAQIMGGSTGTAVTGSNDTISAASGDALTVAGSNDTINGSGVTIGLYALDIGTTVNGSNDTVVGISGDTMTVTGANDTISGSSMTINLNAGDTGANVFGIYDTINGASGDSVTVTGNSNVIDASNDTITFANNSTYEQIQGSNDIINTGAGSYLSVSGNSDSIAFSNTPGASTVSGFNTSDVLQFSHTLFANFAAAMSDATQVGANTVFTIDGSDSVTLANIAKSALTASNFHFA